MGFLKSSDFPIQTWVRKVGYLRHLAEFLRKLGPPCPSGHICPQQRPTRQEAAPGHTTQVKPHSCLPGVVKLTTNSLTAACHRPPLPTQTSCIVGPNIVGANVFATNLADEGLRSVARNNKATRLLTRPCRTTKSSAKDLSLRIVKLQYTS